jgi:hypothetical protein
VIDELEVFDCPLGKEPVAELTMSVISVTIVFGKLSNCSNIPESM